MAISFLAAVVVCLQLTQIKAAPEWQIAGATAWTVELAIFGTAVYAWRSRISLSGWILGILVLIFLRLLLGTTAALSMSLFQNVGHFTTALDRTATLGPRVCMAFFSLMVFYPLRVLLPIRQEHRPDRKRFAERAMAMNTIVASKEGEPAVLLVGHDHTIPVWQTRPKPGVAAAPDPLPVTTIDLEGSIDLPLNAVLAQIPRELWGENAGGYNASHPVPVPLDVIIPQLKEARIAVRLGEIHQWLPPGAMRDPSELDLERGASLILLPLELVVPQIPCEVFELPAPSPPAWANIRENEMVLFATVSTQ